MRRRRGRRRVPGARRQRGRWWRRAPPHSTRGEGSGEGSGAGSEARQRRQRRAGGRLIMAQRRHRHGSRGRDRRICLQRCRWRRRRCTRGSDGGDVAMPRIRDRVRRPRMLAAAKAGVCGPIKLGGLGDVCVRKLFQKIRVIDVAAKYGDRRVGEVDGRAMLRWRGRAGNSRAGVAF